MNYKHDIDLFITHPDDTISNERFLRQSVMFEDCLKAINNYRTKRSFPEIKYTVFTGASFNGNMSDESRKERQKAIENSLNKDNGYAIDYFVFTEESTHQSHKECNHIAMSMLRSPFIENCKDVLIASYPQSAYGIVVNDTWKLNSYIEVDREQVDLLCDCIGGIYGEKNWGGSILGADNFETYLKYFGIKSGKTYAQPFGVLKHLFTL